MEILTYPNDILRTTCDEVTKLSEVSKLFKPMLKLMEKSRGIGLAAPQVGINKRFFVMDLVEPLVFINPVIIEGIGEVECEEGCLSFPGQLVKVKRFKHVKVSYRNAAWASRVRTFYGLSSICIQHEIDHLNGILFIDKEVGNGST